MAVYMINGVSIHEGHTGWRVLRSGTNTQGGITNNLIKVSTPNRPGYSQAPSTFAEQVIVLVVRTPRNRLDELLALCAEAKTLTLNDDPLRVLNVELASAIPAGEAPFDSLFDVTVTLSAYEGVWRDRDLQAVGPTDVTAPVQNFSILPGISAPVFDGDFFLRGVFGEFTLLDVASGSWVKTIRAWPGTASTGLLYVGSTQQAFSANESNPWVPVSDMSNYIDVSGNGGFRMSPMLVSGNPKNREVQLKLTTLSQTNTTLRIRARRAYRMG